MNLLDKLRGALGFGPKLRNKPGGMAWINGIPDTGTGEAATNCSAVRTVRLTNSGHWEIDPPIEFRVRGLCRGFQGHIYSPGELVRTVAVLDEFLEPWKEDGVTDSEVRDLYAPAPEKVLA
jgi:hypothetical protein